MKILIAEDDSASRKFLFEFFSQYGKCDLAADGLETLEAFLTALRAREPYNLISLDIMMPKVDGVKVLSTIRDLETQMGLLPEKRSKIIMVTAFAETQFVKNAFKFGCDAYASKPVDTAKLAAILQGISINRNQNTI